MKEVQKSKLPKFTGQEGGSKAKVWLIGVKNLALRHTLQGKRPKIPMSTLKGDALLWCVNEETKM